MTAPHKVTAVEKLQRSQLSPQVLQAELMGADIDVKSVETYLQGKIKFDSVDMIKDITVSRTVEGASTVTLSIIDAKREVLRSGLLSSRLDILIDGLWFRLVQINKQGDLLSLTFEDREVAVLRTYKKKKIAHRSQVTRAEFILNLIREVKEERIPVVIPELHKVEPIAKTTDLFTFAPGYSDPSVLNKTGGIPDSLSDPASSFNHRDGQKNKTGAVLRSSLMVKTSPADKAQIQNANIILAVGQSLGASRKVLVSSIMVAIQESAIRNLPYGDKDSLGIFQQRASWGSAEARLDVATAARAYFDKAMKIDQSDPVAPLGEIAQGTQRSAHPNAYDQWQDQAEAFVTAYGIPGSDISSANLMGGATTADSGNYIFYRGVPVSAKKGWKQEDSWTCIQRLAGEVQFRAFFVSGVFYYISEPDLFAQKPTATVTEFSEGVEGLDGDYDIGKTASEIQFTARVGTWVLPPGSVVVLQDMGPWDGRWLVNQFDRSMYDSKATITLKKPEPKLKEPALNDINKLGVSSNTWALPAGVATPTVQTSILHGGGFVPTNAPYVEEREDQGRDFKTTPGGPIVAPGDGKVVRIGINPNGFGTSYPIVEFETGPYAGKTMYIGHCLSALAVGQKFIAGQKLATTGTTGQESWNGNASEPGWCEIGYAPGGSPGPWGQGAPF